MPENQDFAAAYAQFRQQYAEHLTTELRDLAEFVNADPGLILDADAVRELHHRLHKLAGSAGTFGFEHLGTAARQIELQMQHWLEEAPRNIPDSWQQIVEQIQQFPELLESKGTTPPEPAAADGSANTPAVMAASQTSAPSSEKAVLNVFLYNDDQAIAEEMASTLRNFGFQVSCFAEIDPDQIDNHDIRNSIAIIDTEIVQTQGTQSLDALGQMPRLFTSNQSDFATRIMIARAGGEGLFLHPVDIPKLVDRISELLQVQEDQPYRVFIVEDDQYLARHYQMVLEAADMHVHVLDEPSNILDAVEEHRPEIILMDLYMPEYSGAELARLLRLQDDWLHTPIVYLSGETNLKKQMGALGHAGDDFITKPLSDEQLSAAVQVRVSRARKLSELMARDGLTGLYNHTHIKDLLTQELARTQRSDRPLSLVMLDLDKFKTVNDTYGHSMGDRVIKTLAHLLQQRTRTSDILGRYGGEEFAIILPECEATSARRILDDIRQRFGQIEFPCEDGVFRVTLSAGIAQSHGNDQGEALFIAADEALYTAKKSGRNQICLAPKTLEGEPT